MIKPAELKLCGMAAVKARFQRNPGSIQRLFFDYATGKRIGIMCKALAAAKKVYRCVEPEELEKISGTLHHGGIVAVVAAPLLQSPSERDLLQWAKKKEGILFLDRIGNAHNLGAIARTAGFFGVPRIVISADAAAAKPNEAAYRVSEGGLEALEVWVVSNPPDFLYALQRAGFEVIGASAHGGKAGSGAAKRPACLVMGNEEHGLAPEVAKACSRLITLPGSGAVESLNVSVATAVMVWDLFRR